MAPIAPSPSVIVARTDSGLRVFRSDGVECLFPAETRHASPSAQSPTKPSTALTWYPSGKLLAEGTATGSILFRHHDGLHSIRRLEPPEKHQPGSPIVAMHISSGSRYLATASAERLVSIWDMRQSSVLATFRSDSPVLALSFQNTADSRYLACATAHSISLYSRATERHVAHFTVSATPNDSFSSTQRSSMSAPNVKLTAMSFSPHRHNLLAATDDTGCVSVWDITEKLSNRAVTDPNLTADVTSTYSRFTTPLRAPATDLSFTTSSGEASLCVGGFDKQLRIFDKSLKKLLFSVLCTAPISSVSFASDGEHVALGFTNGSISVMKLDVLAGTGKVILQIPNVYISSPLPGNKHFSTAVRAVHFQPSIPTPKPLKNSKGQTFERFAAQQTPSPTANKTPVIPRENFPRNNGINIKPSTAEENESVHEPVRFRAKRSIDGPRDSDIFSPLVPRTGSDRHRLREESSGRQSPPNQTVARERKPIEPEGGMHSFRFAPNDEPSNARYTRPVVDHDALLSNDRGALSTKTQHMEIQPTIEDDSWDADPADSDSVDSIVEKTAIMPTPRNNYDTHSDVSQLQGSTVSEYISGVPGEGREHTGKATEDDASSSYSDYGRRRFQVRKSTSESHITQALPPRPPRSNTGEQFKPTFDPGTSSSTDLSPSSMHGLEDTSSRNAKTMHAQDEDNLQLSESRTSSEHDPIEMAGSNMQEDGVRSSLSGMRDRDGARPAWLASFTAEMRDFMAQEVDAIRNDLRSDILNIHTELVVSTARHSQDMKTALAERDNTITRLEAEIRRLRSDNDRLRTKYSLR